MNRDSTMEEGHDVTIDEKRLAAAIHVEEHHCYRVEVGTITRLNWQTGHLTVRVHVPYEGHILDERNRTLRDWPAHGDPSSPVVPLGRVELALPAKGDLPPIQVALEAGEALPTRLKNGSVAVFEAKHQFDAAPEQTLINFDAEISEGAAVEELQAILIRYHHDEIDELLTNEQCLHITLLAPDLYTRTLQEMQTRELNAMLREQESSRQILVPDPSNIAELAKSIAALANTAGGRILLGVDKRGNLVGLPELPHDEQRALVEAALLRACLSCQPPVAIAKPDYLTESDYAEGLGQARRIARIVVSANQGLRHRVGNRVYRRTGNTFLEEVASATQVDPVASPSHDVEMLLARGQRPDVAIVDANNAALENIGLGPIICGMVNAGERGGLILIRNLPQPEAAKQNAFSRLLNPNNGSIRAQLEQFLHKELARCLPLLSLSTPKIVQVGPAKEQVALIQLGPAIGPVALYDNRGYNWNGRELHVIDAGRLLELYIERRTSSRDSSFGSKVELASAELTWRMQPPNPFEVDIFDPKNGSMLRCHYDIQRQAMCWPRNPFAETRDGSGWYRTLLVAPLRYALATTTEQKTVVTDMPALNGNIAVRYYDVLPSGLTVTPIAQTANTWFGTLPVFRSTKVTLELAGVNAQQLFKRRRRMSIVRFRVPDVTLDRERANDLRQACEDLGFRIIGEPLVQEGDGYWRVAVLRGVRNKGFYDVRLLMRASCERNPVRRELRYAGGRSDSKDAYAATLHLRLVFLWSHDEAQASQNADTVREIANLHIGFYQLVKQRLRFLRTE